MVYRPDHSIPERSNEVAGRWMPEGGNSQEFGQLMEYRTRENFSQGMLSGWNSENALTVFSIVTIVELPPIKVLTAK